MQLPLNERFTSVQKDDLKAALGRVVNEGETRETAALPYYDVPTTPLVVVTPTRTPTPTAGRPR